MTAHRFLNTFCAAPGDLEAEREAFYRAVAQVNENAGIGLHLLFAPLSIVPAITDKTKFQAAVDENIRLCSYYILALDDTWGPPLKNFEQDYRLALECRDDASLPMKEVAVLLKNPAAGRALLGEDRARCIEYADVAGFESIVRDLLSEWLGAPPIEITRREAAGADEEFVRQLIMDTVAEELGMAGWPEAMRGPLLNIQYQARRKGLRENFPDAVEEVLHVDGTPAGWAAICRGEEAIHLIDIAIQARFRGRKLGTARIGELIEEAVGAGKTVRLSVVATNRALRLYQRLGFVPTGGDGVRVFMEHPGGRRLTPAAPLA
jgi:ribosomal protein S18 acetylase RimI-like enzyme